MSGITRLVNRSLLQVQKFSPEILTYAGVAGVVGSTILIARATLKLESKIEQFETEKNDVDHFVNSDKEKSRELFKARRRFAVSMVKLYGPGISLGVVSLGSIVSAHGILRKRNLAYLAAYKAVETSYSEYRKRVVDELGEEKEEQIRLNLRALTDETTEKDEQGNDVPMALDKRFNPTHYSQYARFFDQTNVNWQKQPEYNKIFLQAQQRYLNDKFIARGHMFLNDVYDALGIERSSEGAVVGWLVSKDGDNYIDFGMFNGNSEKVREFINGQESAILLDFNVDGVIWDKLPTR